MERNKIHYLAGGGWGLIDYFTKPQEQAWLLSFGAYAETKVLVLDSNVTSLDDALESAAAVLPKGFFEEPEYPHAQPSDKERDAAEVDLTYTESGWLISHEWFVSEVDIDEALKGWTVSDLCEALQKKEGEKIM